MGYALFRSFFPRWVNCAGNSRRQLELDLWIPSHNIGIEFQGRDWIECAISFTYY
jgi:hypothetical protein